MRLHLIATASIVASWGLLHPAVRAETTTAQLGRKSGDDAARNRHGRLPGVGMATTKQQDRQLGSNKRKASRRSMSLSEEARTIFERVKFVIESTQSDLCGSRGDQAPDLEAAFLDFFEREQEECDTERGQAVESLVLAEYREPRECNSPSRTGKGKGKGKGGSKSKGKGKGGSKSKGKGKGKGGSKSKGSSNSMVSKGSRRNLETTARRLQNDQKSEGLFDREVSCTRGCGRRRLVEESKISPGDRRLNSRSSSSSCPVDLVDSLREAGYEGVRDARIKKIKEIDCSPGSRSCLKSGTCCGVCGCKCTFPSESLCEANDFCIGGARPFEEDFCEDFFPQNDEGSFVCEKESCHDSSSASS
uniref:Uncharacterized protein n=1 Tax=Odontella aurita TaxID=265563 RepID=A0A6U6F9D4_9STRA|mmetsp:Transcript_33201/g.98674  ORF Transcript_33201/g.98674 Transcript_33201/m.98674 type:complete len:361 (+) Transcript_33201:299-1381(+)